MMSPTIDYWLLFIFVFTALLVVSFIMIRQSRNFYTKDPVIRKFSIMELQVPATPKELFDLIKGLYELPIDRSRLAIRSLRNQLRLDFLFMPLAYGSIFLLCWRIAHKMQLSFGINVFLVFAFLQVVPWVCDIIENVYLLRKISNTIKPTEPKKHILLLWMEAAKWGIALTAMVCSLSAICYFWLTGDYSQRSLGFMLLAFGEIAVFLVLLRSARQRG